MRLWILGLVVVVGCSTGGEATPVSCPPEPAIVRTGDATLTVEVAVDGETRARGLMGVASLPEDRGMAFVWPEPTTGTFWMKDTLIPLSIAFVDADGRIVTIREMTPCTTADCPTYAAEAPYMWAVEANAGWFDRHGIEVGDEIALHDAGCS